MVQKRRRHLIIKKRLANLINSSLYLASIGFMIFIGYSREDNKTAPVIDDVQKIREERSNESYTFYPDSVFFVTISDEQIGFPANRN